VPLSEFAKRQRSQHTGHGRRDALSAGERTRILRMLRDEGGRIADEDQDDAVYIGAAPGAGRYDFDFEDDSAPEMTVPKRGDVPAKPAVVVGLDKARRQKRQSAAPPPNPSARPKSTSVPPPLPRTKPPTGPPRPGQPMPKRPGLPRPFDEPTRAIDDNLLQQLRSAPPPPGSPPRGPFDEQPTRMANVDARLLDAEAEMTRPGEGPKFLPAKTEQTPNPFENNVHEEATRMANVDAIGKVERAPRKPPERDPERTRAVDIRNDKSMSDIDWDID